MSTMSEIQDYEYLIVGAGISGMTLAERISSVLKRRVLVIEKRGHIGGNCFDFYNEDGLLVPKYGPHFFHTNDEEVWEYINRFSEWVPYEHRVLSFVDNMLVPIPVNITTVNMLFGVGITDSEGMKRWLDNHAEKIPLPKNSEEAALAWVGKDLYEKLFKHYTIKQWNKSPTDLDPSITSRIPVRTNFDDRYFTDMYQAMPKYGYTKMFEKMVSNPLIHVVLNCDYLNSEYRDMHFKKIFFTGPIDTFFAGRSMDKLEYRSLRFEFETHNVEYFQSRAQINYPNTERFTRITEPKHATFQKHLKTTIIKEYGTSEGEPYYPIINEKNLDIFEHYKEEAKKLEVDGVYFLGRLAQFKYFNMDQAFRNALDFFESVMKLR